LPGPYDDNGQIGLSVVRSILIVSPETLYLGSVSGQCWCGLGEMTYGLLSWFGVPVDLLVNDVGAPKRLMLSRT
jgi:hypothetical protein